MNYLEFHGLESEPFSNAPVTGAYFGSEQHQRALSKLLYAADNMKGLAVMTGEIGAGKTTLARRMLDNLSEQEYEAALLVIINAGVTASWLLRRVALQLGVASPAAEKTVLLSQIYQRLMQIHQSGRKAVVIIDEAQLLRSPEILEEIRGLLNLEVPGRKLLTFVLVGMDELDANLRQDPALRQRMAVKCVLEALDAASTEAYIKHRLRVAGAKKMPFSQEALPKIFAYSKGVPRVINTLCDNTLFESFMTHAPAVDEKIVDRCADDLGLASGVA